MRTKAFLLANNYPLRVAEVVALAGARTLVRPQSAKDPLRITDF
jgi:hypothetical protein